MKGKAWRRAASVCAFALTAAALLTFLGNVFRPVQVCYGSTWRAFRAEPANSIDVLYLGSSMAYCDFDPVEVYRHSGLTGYVMGGGEQTMSLTYWYLREALTTQTPQAVVIEPTGVFFQRYQNYTQLNVSQMPMSLNRLGAIFTASEPELREGLLCDLILYHGRWRELGWEDVQRGLTPGTTDDLKGFTGNYGQAQAPILTEDVRPIEEELFEENLGWFRRCLALCEERGIPVVTLVNPTFGLAREEQYARVGREAEEGGAVYYDWSRRWEALGLEPSLHFYDGGHMNREGAAVYAQALAELLTGDLGLSPMAQTPENTAAWQAAVVQRDGG